MCPPGLKQQLATSFMLGNAVCISFALVTLFGLTAVSVNMEISFIIRELRHAQ